METPLSAHTHHQRSTEEMTIPEHFNNLSHCASVHFKTTAILRPLDEANDFTSHKRARAYSPDWSLNNEGYIEGYWSQDGEDIFGGTNTNRLEVHELEPEPTNPGTTAGHFGDVVPELGSAPTQSESVVSKTQPNEDVEDKPGKTWSDTERSALFNYILGPDADQNFETMKTNCKEVFKSASKSVVKGRNPSAVKSQWERSRKQFQSLYDFRKVTGGGGDGDHDIAEEEGFDWDSDEFLSKRIAVAAQKGRVENGAVTPKILRQWEKKGWYKLFKERYHSNPKVNRQANISSAKPVSPPRSSHYYGNETQNSGPNSASSSSLSVPATPNTNHRLTSAQQHRNSSHDMMSEMAKLLNNRSQLESKRLEMAQARVDTKTLQSKYDFLVKIRDDPNSSFETVQKAEQKINDLLDTL
ncbi:hypothetical protein K435DRAFT_859380 [Dendrothele bispora CBS 962.96]|uniref:Uncharacterized protein n=1 Tax=Dendrothele bispora (strain CBS 962.96) TaxID=1314807 RepID=A0A4V4HFM9_DENBC|nr:hypothetical protein K435DRAFT_859380 [Dendrothele bispora CBS 962.96]